MRAPTRKTYTHNLNGFKPNRTQKTELGSFIIEMIGLVKIERAKKKTKNTSGKHVKNKEQKFNLVQRNEDERQNVYSRDRDRER